MTQFEIARHLGYLIIAVSPLIILFYFLFKESLQKPYTEDDWHRDQDAFYEAAHLEEQRHYDEYHKQKLTDNQPLPKQDPRKLQEW